ncbi:hypothetical protein BP422_13830 [Brevibacillus formosus]|uniref:Sporulation stage II protein D amidase enhancer LytB N-terminal domain-containing protein n=1 Tax=Brevibacillus formosus TaxID=54913 RepID=A0A220MHV4_9BACL|nr:SpoIID/LytB domain-containing protein [Brevibacillus formosus]ASJ54543.1 hypothetical protein BP422_13830 [Brevibacillus formosus]
MLKKSLSSLLVTGLLLGLYNSSIPVQAFTSDPAPFSVVEQMFEYENAKKLDNFAELWVKDREEDYKIFVNDEENRKNNRGLFGIKKARIVDWKELSPEVASNYSLGAENYLSTYKDAKFYYIAVDYEVDKEDKYFLNGVNYSIVTMVLEDGTWQIAQIQKAPVDSMVSDNVGFGTDDEKEIAKINKESMKTGKFKNREGKTLIDTSASEEDLKKERSSRNSVDQVKQLVGEQATIAAVNDHVRPSYIKVRMTDPYNISKAGCSSSCDKDIPFYDYVTNVLPNEWDETIDKAETLKAGAMAVKMYGWWAHYYDVGYGISADVYDDTRDQTFLYLSAAGVTNDAINAVGSLGMQTDTGKLFLSTHVRGQYAAGNQYSGTAWHLGSRYWGDRGYSYNYILQYYYNNSSKVGGSGHSIQYFTY